MSENDKYEWLKMAINNIKIKVLLYDVFVLKDLFDIKVWEQLSSRDRQSFGKYFAKKVREGDIDTVQEYQPNKKGSCRYKRIK